MPIDVLALLEQEVLINPNARETFRRQRGVVGNSLGKFRWIDASTNRSSEAWNSIIPGGSRRLWGTAEIAKFQNLIDLRTLVLYERLVQDSGIARIVSACSPS